MKKFQEQVILITGGASGIGLSITKHFVELGSFVFVCDLQEQKGKDLVKEHPDNVHFILCDITNEEQVTKMVATIK